MAQSPAHKVGQIVGYALELSLLPLLETVASDHGLYLDTIGSRPARSGKKLITWVDDASNKHNLDFVLERGGSDAVLGTPVAFIEVAWRRYTKHSIAKAGEITQALVPLRRSFAEARPFLGAVVAGAWTDGGLSHMRNQGLRVLHIPLADIVACFAIYNIDLDLAEDTPEAYLSDQVRAWEELGQAQRGALAASLMESSATQYAAFRLELDAHLTRQVERVLVLPLYGTSLAFASSAEAVAALKSLPTTPDTSAPFVRLEVQVRYSNGDRVEASFASTADAVAFLERQV